METTMVFTVWGIFAVFRVTVFIVSILVFLLPITGLASEADVDDRIQLLERQLEQQRTMLEKMQQELELLKASREQATAEPPAALEQEAAATLTGTKADSTAEDITQAIEGRKDWQPSMEISGFADLDMIYDFDRVAPDYEATLVPTTIPTEPGVYGSDGNFIYSIKQSRLSFVSKMHTPLGDAMGWIEFDLFGTGSDAGRTAFNLRQAWFELGRWGAGQTWSTFIDISTWPNVYDWWGPSGMALNRNPMLRYTLPLDESGSQFAIALEQQNGSFNAGIFTEIAPGLADSLDAKTEAPDLIANWRIERDWGHVQLAGVARHLAYETLDTPDNKPDGSVFGWGFNLTGIFNVFDRDQIKYGITYGKGIASFINDGGGSNIVPEYRNDDVKAVAMPSLGFLLYYDHYWSENWSSAIGISRNNNDLTNLQISDQPNRVTYASTNLFYTHSPYLVTGIEALYGKLETADGSEGSDFRLQFTTRYIFSHVYTSR